MTKVDIEDIKKEDAEEQAAEKTAAGQEDSGAAEEAAAGETSSQDEDPEEAGEAGKQEETSEEKTEDDGDTRYLRLMADFQNYKKRVEKEKADLCSYANEKLISEMLEVIDNFERALQQEGGGDGFKEGMEMIFKQLSDVLKKSGLAEIPALGEEFDPNFHNAVMKEETEEYESGKVSGVMQKGYTLNGKVIRPSMVKVAD